MTVAEPVIGVLIGMLALNEQFNNSPAALAWEAFGALVMLWGTVLLARSPLVAGRRTPSRLRQLEDRVLHHHPQPAPVAPLTDGTPATDRS
jgi:hypothetical protein